MKILVTGGAGFIGSAVIRQLIRETDATIVNLDKLTYAATPEALEECAENPRYRLVEGDIRDRIGAIDTSKCPLYMLTGEYDYSCAPADTEAAAALIEGAKVVIMKGLAHFPMSENPAVFRDYLLPVLEEIRSGDNGN